MMPHPKTYFVEEVEMQNHFVKIHKNIINSICKCTTRQISRNFICFLVPHEL